MRPSRIVVGEVRQEESLDLLIAFNSGTKDRHMVSSSKQHWGMSR